MIIEFTVNGKYQTLETDPAKRLLDILREDLGLTGVKEGCGEGECGACSVFYNGVLANSCLLAAGQIEGADIVTIEGFRETERYKKLEAAFSGSGAVQCGFCTPGFIMAEDYLLRNNPNPTEEEVRTGLSGNLCRCTGYRSLIEAVLTASREGGGLW